MYINFYKLVIASYLHDMWKLLWRWWIERKSTKYNVAHAEQVFTFFNDKKKNYSEFWKEIWLIASLHHAKDFYSYKNRKDENQKQLARLIYMADNISSSERIDEENLEEKREYEHIKNFWLRPVFENIFTEQLSSTHGYIPCLLEDVNFKMTDKWATIDKAENGFLKNILKWWWDESVNNWFKKLAQNFSNELDDLVSKYNYDNLTEEQCKILINQLDIILQNYFSFIPSDAYKSIGDISLYDHTKTTAAIAVTLFKNEIHLWKDIYNKGTNEIIKEEISLIAWDFPSIQKYIFWNIKKSEWLAKRLRAKSLTVQLLNESVIEYICYKLWLPRANILMNAWWKFVILTWKVKKDEIKNIKHSINQFLIDKYDWNIRFALISQEKKISELFPHENLMNVQDVFSCLFDLLSQEKYQLYDTDNLKSMFVEKSVSGKVVCNLCGLYYADQEEENWNACCENCKKEKELWEKIVKQSCKWVFLRYHNGEKFDFSIDFDWLNKDELFVQWNSWKLNNNTIPMIAKSINLYVPKDWDSTKEFEKIASKNKKYLCMVKWDIDSMWLLFKHGFDYSTNWWIEIAKNTIYSVSRLVQISRMLELFFWKYLEKEIANEFPDVYTVFSGGDDFVFIVPFRDRFSFTYSISEKFEKFVAENKHIHFSLWISIFKDKTPFSQVDYITENLLKSGKRKVKEKIACEEEFKKYWLDLLSTRWICIYDNRIVLDSKEVENYGEKLNLNWPLEQWWVTDTMLYTLHTQITQMYEILENMEENKSQNWAQYLHIWSRIFYMLKKNIKWDKLKPIEDDLKETLLVVEPNISNMKWKLMWKWIRILNYLYNAREK